MKTALFLTSLIFTSQTFAYDERLMVNVEKANALLARAYDSGRTPSGAECFVELRQIEDGYYTVYLADANKEIMVGLDIAPYGKIHSHWTKRSLTVKHDGCFESQTLLMKEDFSTRKLSVNMTSDFGGNVESETCLLPLK